MPRQRSPLRSALLGFFLLTRLKRMYTSPHLRPLALLAQGVGARATPTPEIEGGKGAPQPNLCSRPTATGSIARSIFSSNWVADSTGTPNPLSPAGCSTRSIESPQEVGPPFDPCALNASTPNLTLLSICVVDEQPLSGEATAEPWLSVWQVALMLDITPPGYCDVQLSTSQQGARTEARRGSLARRRKGAQRSAMIPNVSALSAADLSCAL